MQSGGQIKMQSPGTGASQNPNPGCLTQNLVRSKKGNYPFIWSSELLVSPVNVLTI